MKRNFFRRAFAYFLDLLIVGVLATILATVILSPFGVNVVAPDLINTKQCKSENVVSDTRMEELLPSAQGGKHRQTTCQITNMFLTTHKIAILAHTQTSGEGVTNGRSITYPVDDQGNSTSIFSSSIILNLAGPFIFALLLFKLGTTPGKRLFGISVQSNDGRSLRYADFLKRELLKGAILIFIGIYLLAEFILLQPIDLDVSASWLGTILSNSDLFWAIVVLAIVLGVVIFWYMLGSFIRWRGQTFWDGWSGMITKRASEEWPLTNIEDDSGK